MLDLMTWCYPVCNLYAALQMSGCNVNFRASVLINIQKHVGKLLCFHTRLV